MKKRVLRTISYFLTILLVSFIATSAIFYVKLSRSHDKLEQVILKQNEAFLEMKEGHLLSACKAIVSAQNSLKNADFASEDTLAFIHTSSVEICAKINKK